MPELDIKAETAARTRTQITLKDIFIEYIGHRDNWLFIGLCLGIAVWLAASGPTYRDLIWFAVGWIIFMPQEYFTHVYILHCRLPKFKPLYLWLYRLHYGHHDLPKRHDLMYMPLWLTLPMMVSNLLLIWLITPESRAFWAAYCGALAGYLVFEWAHLLCHVPYAPKSRLWRHARSQHLLHHFFDEKQWYAVTPGLDILDRLMGTKPKREKTARSDSCRYLGLNAQHPWLTQARAHFASRSSGNLSASRLWLNTESNGE